MIIFSYIIIIQFYSFYSIHPLSYSIHSYIHFITLNNTSFTPHLHSQQYHLIISYSSFYYSQQPQISNSFIQDILLIHTSFHIWDHHFFRVKGAQFVFIQYRISESLTFHINTHISREFKYTFKSFIPTSSSSQSTSPQS